MFNLFKKVRLTTKLHSFSKAKVQLFLIGGDFFDSFLMRLGQCANKHFFHSKMETNHYIYLFLLKLYNCFSMFYRLHKLM
jgi:hypothetical protein